MEKKVLFLGKSSSASGSGKYHLFDEKSSAHSICGLDRSKVNKNREGFIRWNIEEDDFSDLTGFGSACKKCMDYVRGIHSDKKIPEPEKKRFATKSIIEKYKRNVSEVKK